jgi:hypothetical protein
MTRTRVVANVVDIAGVGVGLEVVWRSPRAAQPEPPSEAAALTVLTLGAGERRRSPPEPLGTPATDLVGASGPLASARRKSSGRADGAPFPSTFGLRPHEKGLLPRPSR